MSPTVRTPIRVLCVDDNHDAADSLALVLRLSGLDAETAFDGTSALRTAEWFAPHVCVTDINMPGMDGYELARRLREHTESRPLLLIAVTARTTDGDRRLSADAGFDLHLIKPADPEELIRAIIAFAERLYLGEQDLEADCPILVPVRGGAA